MTSLNDDQNDITRSHIQLVKDAIIGHYRILEKIGAGGMGEVYLAEDTELNRKVALKFLPLHLCQDADCRSRFKREAQAAAKLNHPNIITIHEVYEYNGRPFFAMEFVDGLRLDEYFKQKSPSLDKILDLAVQVCEGLREAHNSGIIHRDVKPGNILMDKNDRVRILDFGLAAVKGVDKLTKTGSTMGTLHYMSPEQTRGEALDERSDIFSFGVLVYEMIAGHLPFKGDHEPAIIYSITNEEPEPLARYKSGVPDELQRIVSKALAKDKNLRYQHADEILADLRVIQQEVPHDSPHGRRNKRLPLLIGGSVLLVAILVAGYFFTRPEHAPPAAKSIAVLPFVDMSPQMDQEYFCDGMTEELINRLSNIGQLRVPARTSAFYFKGKTEDIREIGSKLKVQTVLEGSVRKAGDELRITAQLISVENGYHLWSETYDRKLEDIFAIQDEISSAIVNALQLKLTPHETQKLSEHPIDDEKAYECYLKAWRQIYRFDELSLDSAFIYLRTAIDIMGDNAELYAGMAMAYAQRANMGIGQEDDLKRAEDYAKKALALKPDLSSALTELGNLSIYKDYPQNWHDLFSYNKKALAANPSQPVVLRHAAIFNAMIGRPSQAQEHADLFEKQDPLNPWRHMVRGYCYEVTCRFGPAVEQFRLFYQADSTSPLALQEYALALALDGKRDEALAIIERATPGNARNVEAVFCLLLKYAFLGDRESALRLLTPEFQKTCRRDCEWSYFVAARLSLAGATEESLDWLENAVKRGFINYPFMQCDPFLDNIRGEERFRKLMEWAKYEWEHFEV